MTDTTTPKATQVKAPTAFELKKQLQAELALLKPDEKVVEEKSPKQIERERRTEVAIDEFAGFVDTITDLLKGANTDAILGAVRNLRLARDKAVKGIAEIEDSAIDAPVAAPDGF